MIELKKLIDSLLNHAIHTGNVIEQAICLHSKTFTGYMYGWEESLDGLVTFCLACGKELELIQDELDGVREAESENPGTE